jgi:hypothetical protein
MRILARGAALSLLLLGLANIGQAASMQLVVISADNAITPTGGNEVTLAAGGGTVTVEILYEVGAEGLVDLTFDLTSTATASGFFQPSLIQDSNNGVLAPTATPTLSGSDILGYGYGGPGISSATSETVSLGTGTFSVTASTVVDIRIVEIFDFAAQDPTPTLTSATITVVPEPSPALLLATGLALLSARARPRRLSRPRACSWPRGSR